MHVNRIGLIALTASAFLAYAKPSDADVFHVTNTADSGPGSLRAAIYEANADPVLDEIRFAIPGPGPHVISPTSRMYTMSSPVFINGYSQDGSEPPTVSQLQEFLERKIAGYKIPRILETLEELPRDDSGDVSKELLREMYRHRDFDIG